MLKIERAQWWHVGRIAALEQICFTQAWPIEVIRTQVMELDRVFLVAFWDRKIVGYVAMAHVLDEGHITNLAVAPDMRRRGIAEELMAAALRNATELQLRYIYLEVRESNIAAYSLYEKLGFAEVGKRPGYYTGPNEDAILMTLILE